MVRRIAGHANDFNTVANECLRESRTSHSRLTLSSPRNADSMNKWRALHPWDPRRKSLRNSISQRYDGVGISGNDRVCSVIWPSPRVLMDRSVKVLDIRKFTPERRYEFSNSRVSNTVYARTRTFQNPGEYIFSTGAGVRASSVRLQTCRLS